MSGHRLTIECGTILGKNQFDIDAVPRTKFMFQMLRWPIQRSLPRTIIPIRSQRKSASSIEWVVRIVALLLPFIRSFTAFHIFRLLYGSRPGWWFIQHQDCRIVQNAHGKCHLQKIYVRPCFSITEIVKQPFALFHHSMQTSSCQGVH